VDPQGGDSQYPNCGRTPSNSAEIFRSCGTHRAQSRSSMSAKTLTGAALGKSSFIASRR